MEKPQTAHEIAAALRLALRGLVRPVAVLTAEHRGVRHAMAATAFCEVSMDPPSMLVCINRSNATYTAVAEGTEIGLSLLSEEQEEVSRRCGGGAAGEDKFAVGEWLLGRASRHDSPTAARRWSCASPNASTTARMSW